MSKRYHIPKHGYQFPELVPEDPQRCTAQASPFFVDSRKYFRQCSRKRGYGPNGELCVQHARLALSAEGK